jgi:xylulokinase
MVRPVVVAYDVGTSGVKAVVVDGSGTVLASHVEAYGLLTPRPGWVEQDVDQMAASLGVASRAVLGSPGIDPAAVAAVGVTAQMFSVVPVDRERRPLRPMLSWLDQRADAVAAELQRRAGPDEGHGVFGAVLTGKDIVPKIAWLQANEPDGRTATYLDCKEAIVARLTGSTAIDACGASAFRLTGSGSGPIAWDAAACELAGVPVEQLPPIAPATSVVGGVTAEAAALTGLRAGTPVVVGAGDVPAGQIGAGAGAHGDAHLSLGTAAYFGITADRHLADPHGRLGPLRHVIPDHWILWLETATGGGALAWFRRQLAGFAPRGPAAVPDHEQIDRAAAAVADEMDGLLFAPWLTGERVPLFDDAVRGAFLGVGLHHGGPHLARAVMEGVACQIATTLDYAVAYGVRPSSVRIVGGGGIGATWTGIIADTLGLPLDIVSEPQDAAARGAAACALVGAGLAADPSVAVPATIERTVEPDAERAGRARERLDRFRALYPLLRTIGRDGAASAASGPPLQDELGRHGSAAVPA